MSNNEAKVNSSEAETKTNIREIKSTLNDISDYKPSSEQLSNKNNNHQARKKAQEYNHPQGAYVSTSYQPYANFKYNNNYFETNNLPLAAKQYLSQFNPVNQQSITQSTIRSTNDNFNSANKKGIKSRNQSSNPYDKSNMHKPVHEYVTIEFNNPISVPPKYMSRERKPLPIVNPETKQVLNASHFNSTRSSSIAVTQSNPLDLNSSLKQAKIQPQAKTSKPPVPMSSPHIGRSALNKMTPQSTNNTEFAPSKQNKRSTTRDQRNSQSGTNTKPSNAQSIMTATQPNNKANNVKGSINKAAETTPKADLSENTKIDSLKPVLTKRISPNMLNFPKIKSEKRRYTKEFLLSLKDKQLCNILPKALAESEYFRQMSPSLDDKNFKEEVIPLKSYASVAATAVKPSMSNPTIAAINSPQPIMKRSATRDKIAPEAQNAQRRPLRTQSVSNIKAKNKQYDNNKQNYVQNPRDSSSMRRAPAQIYTPPIARKPEMKIEPLLRSSPTYDVICSIEANSKDPREDMLEEKMYPLFGKEKNEKYFEIFSKIQSEFISQNMGDSKELSKLFSRALVTALCRSCLDSNWKKFDVNLFIKRFPILKRFIKNDQDELETLKAIQALDHKLKHLTGFICILFEIFYTEGLVNEEVFWKWKDNPFQEGHIISVYILKEFFELLAELGSNKTLSSSKQTNIKQTSVSSSKNKNFIEETKSSSLKKNELISLASSSNGNNSRKARIEKSKSKLNSIINSKPEAACSMCLQTLTNLKQQNVQLMSTTCGHIICKQCCTKLLINDAIECPICKKKIDKSCIHDIFL